MTDDRRQTLPHETIELAVDGAVDGLIERSAEIDHPIAERQPAERRGRADIGRQQDRACPAITDQPRDRDVVPCQGHSGSRHGAGD